jgi:hypothetical protein
MRIILVSDPKRADFFEYLVPFLQTQEVYILWYYTKQMDNSHDFNFRYNSIFWKDYKTPKRLLDKVKPDKILFFEILDFWQISLIVACRFYNVRTFFFEHGVGNSVQQVISRYDEIPYKKRLKNTINKLKNGIVRAIRSRWFFYSSFYYLKGNELFKYLLIPLYYKIYLPNEALSKLKFRKRTPDYAVLFNRNNIGPFLLYNEIEDGCILLGGVPFFDKFCNYEISAKNQIVFIDHPYLELKILNWTDQHHQQIARSLERFALEHQTKIIVKLHPKSEISNWLRYSLDQKYISIEQSKDITSEMLSSKIILGYSSTLMNALICCKKNIVLLGWHPTPHIFGDDISQTGLCHVSFDLNDLKDKYTYWTNNNLAIVNEYKYQEYLLDYNFPFDGMSTTRIIEYLEKI